MKHRPLLAAIVALIPVSAAAQACPPNPDIAGDLDRLFSELQSAPSEMAASPINAQIWELWLIAPDAQAQGMLDQGIARLRVADHEGAEAAFGRLIDYCPDYAEGYNQRAFSKFLRGDYGAALEDLDRAVALSPRHVGALSGRALALMGLGRTKAGQAALREALALNPWLSERALLVEPDGEDI